MGRGSDFTGVARTTATRACGFADAVRKDSRRTAATRALKEPEFWRIIPFMVKKNIRKTIEKHNLINKDEHIVIGLSGGPDSVCLFSVLNELKEELGITIHAVHVNHGFRPGAAEEDQAYVEQLCRQNGIECTSFVYDCNAIAAEEGLSSEEAGRKVRYESFLKVAEALMQDVPADKIKIAVAQNADDQAETVLFRLLRGTGTDGLAGMAYSRMEKNIMVIRPLLDTWRKDIEAYCSEHGLQPRTDHTNLQPIYTRNKIRLELIPYLQENFNANIMETLGRLSRIAGEDKDYLWQCAEEAYDALVIRPGFAQPDKVQAGRIQEAQAQSARNQAQPDRPAYSEQQKNAPIIFEQKGLAELPPAIRHRVVMKALKNRGMEQDLTAAHLEAIDGILDTAGESRTVELPDGYRVSVRYGEAVFYREGAGCYKIADFSVGVFVKMLPDERGIAGSVEKKIPETGALCRSVEKEIPPGEMPPKGVRIADCEACKSGRLAQIAQFDADKFTAVHGDVQPVFRTRRPGDYITIKGGRKKIQDLFVDMKVPKEHRDSVLMAAAGSEILWLPQQPEKGVKKSRYSNRYKLEQDTKNVLKLEFVCDI